MNDMTVITPLEVMLSDTPHRQCRILKWPRSILCYWKGAKRGRFSWKHNQESAEWTGREEVTVLPLKYQFVAFRKLFDLCQLFCMNIFHILTAHKLDYWQTIYHKIYGLLISSSLFWAKVPKIKWFEPHKYDIFSLTLPSVLFKPVKITGQNLFLHFWLWVFHSSSVLPQVSMIPIIPIFLAWFLLDFCQLDKTGGASQQWSLMATLSYTWDLLHNL